MSLTDLSLPLQKAVIDALKADPVVAELVAARVFDNVPTNAAYPYISLGPSVSLPELAEETDASEIALQIDVWSRGVGFPECRRIGSAVTAALHDAALVISPGEVQSILLETTRYQRDPDGLTTHGVLTFNILVDANS